MVVAMVVANVVRFGLFGKEGFGGKKEKEPWEKAMEESFNDAMNEAFVDEDDDDNDEDEGEEEEEEEAFTTRFEGFDETEKKIDNNKKMSTKNKEIKFN